MRFIVYILPFLLFSCSQTAQKNNSTTLRDTNSVDTLKSPEEEKLKKRTSKDVENEDRLDSIRLDKVLKEALAFANKNSSKSNFKHDLEIQPDDSSSTVKVNLIFGHLFDNNHQHLLIRRISHGTNIDIYLLKSDKFIPVCSRKLDPVTYVGDTIKDVNGDNQKDFLIHWYPNSGCCQRDVYNVYVYQADKGIFTKDYEFINPTFEPKKKIIRGVEYGHPGEAGLYKYKWNGLQIDTIEFIYHDRNNKGYYIKTKKQYDQTAKDAIKLKAVPKEYLSIESYDWFQWKK